MNDNDRISQLERRMRFQSILFSLGAVGLTGMYSLATHSALQSQRNDVPRDLRARSIEVVDPSGDVIVKIGSEELLGNSGAVYLYNGDEPPSGGDRIPSATLASDGGGQLHLFGPRGEGEASISVESPGSQGAHGRITLSHGDDSPYFTVKGGMNGSEVALYSTANNSSMVLRSGSETPLEIGGSTGHKLFEVVEPSENEGAINLYKDGESARVK